MEKAWKMFLDKYLFTGQNRLQETTIEVTKLTGAMSMP
jgi:hypothetical protein